jgi:hypothetical protein
MFSVNHYVPILRWKRAEKIALRYLQPADKAVITPLIELVPTSFKPGQDGSENPALVLEREAKEIKKDWGTAPFFVDVNHLEECVPPINGLTHPLEYLSDKARMEGLRLVPVTGLTRGDAYQNLVKRTGSDGPGVCFRLTPSEVLDPGFNNRLGDLIARLRLERENVDLVLDYKVFDPSAPTLAIMISHIPSIADWRTFAVACGAFPEDLQQFTPGRHTIAREDWLSYRDQIADPLRLQRRPSFADYTVQYGIYKEPPQRSNPSASIRYALSDRWIIMRGEGIFNKDGPGREQYVANATLLSESDDFYGPNFSYGDSYIYDVSQGIEGHGSPETWIRAGINHHMTVTSRQIASLSESSDIDAPRRASSRILQPPPTRSRSIRGA